MNFWSIIISGLSLGSIYALIALGYTMVYGIARMLNFAHGDIIMVGAFTVIVAITSMGINPLVACVLSVLTCILFGIIIEKIAYKPLRKAPPLTILITAIGVSYFLQSLALIIFGSNQRNFPNIPFINVSPVTMGSIMIRGESISTLGIALITMCLLTVFIQKTKIGKAMRAVSEDKEAAELMGISVDKTITITFAIGSGLAALAGIFFGSTYGFIGAYTGSMPGIKAFVAAVFGGIGSIP
ncbi:MAG: branched-chain amino acid ABC transporter permease, partial [bacterium]